LDPRAKKRIEVLKNVIWIWNRELLIDGESLVRREKVYFVENPNFRSFWESGKLVLSNAIFLVGQ
jgi:hypothetical protein